MLSVNDLEFMPPFFDRYIKLVNPSENILEALENTQMDFQKMEEKLLQYQDFRYEEGKWTPKQILQHVIDNDRVQAYRALAFSREPGLKLPGYDENKYASACAHFQKSMPELLEEFQSVRKSSIMLFSHMNKPMLLARGVCFEVEVCPLALGFQMIGHAMHHIGVLKERYFNRS